MRCGDCVVSTIAAYPTYVTFFSTTEKLAIGGLPFIVAADKPTRRDALATPVLPNRRQLTLRIVDTTREREPLREAA